MSLIGPVQSVRFGKMNMGRLIVGHNPVCGNSHTSAEVNQDMKSYFTPDNVVAMYQHAEKLGIKSLLIRGDHLRLSYLELYRRAGGKLNFLCQTASEMHDVFVNIRICAAAGAEGIYHHGTQTDRFWLSGRRDLTNDYLKCMRDSGVAVGLASHMVDPLDYALQKGWDFDFLMCSFYDPGQGKMRQSAIVAGKPEPQAHEVYLEADRQRMVQLIQSTDKPCCAYKILAASRHCATQDDVKAAYAFAYQNIKPNDAVLVGFFPKYIDQIALGIEYATAACEQPAAECVA